MNDAEGISSKNDETQLAAPPRWSFSTVQKLCLGLGVMALFIVSATLLLAEEPSPTGSASENALWFDVLHAEAEQRGEDGMTISGSTPFQLGYASEKRYLALLGIDDGKAVSVYFPEAGVSMGERLDPKGGTFPFKLKLGSQSERFIAIFSDENMSLSTLMAASEVAAGTATQEEFAGLPIEGVEQSSFILHRQKSP